MDMEFTYSLHAEYRMDRRGVSRADIELVIRRGSKASSSHGSQKKTLRMRGRKIGVAYRQTGPSSFHIATVTVD